MTTTNSKTRIAVTSSREISRTSTRATIELTLATGLVVTRTVRLPSDGNWTAPSYVHI